MRTTGATMEEPGGSCWECEAATDHPITVVVRTPAHHIASVTLCPACYQTYFLPLTSGDPTTLVLRRRDED
jgi:hypothetical protein